METIYFQVRFLNQDLRLFKSHSYGRQLFAPRKLRKGYHCATCGELIPRGDRAWAEVTSCAMNRAHRVHEACVKELS